MAIYLSCPTLFQLYDQITNSGRPINIRTLIPCIYACLPHYSHNTEWFVLSIKRKKLNYFPSFISFWIQNKQLLKEHNFAQQRSFWGARCYSDVTKFQIFIGIGKLIRLSKYFAFGVRYGPHDTNLQPQKLTPWNSYSCEAKSFLS